MGNITQLADDVRAWWVRPEGFVDEEDPRAHEKVLAVLKCIQDEHNRKRDFLLYASMYTGGIPQTGQGTAADVNVRSTPRGRTNLSLNLSRIVVDAVCSRVFAKSKPKLKHVTEGGGPERQEHARQLTMGIDGVFYETDAYDTFVDGGRLGCVYGTGSTRVEPDYDAGKVTIDLYNPWERVIDPGEVFYKGRRMTFYAEHYEDRYVLVDRVRKGLWADGTDEELAYKATQVDRLKGETDEDAEFGFQQVGFRVLVREAWRLPTGKGANDGRYVRAVKNCTLTDKKWDGEGDPFCDFRWTKPILGFYGQGIVELGAGKQAEVNKLIRQIQQGHHMVTGKWLVPTGSGVLKAHINNDLTTILNHAPGLAPQYIVPAIISPEVYAHLWKLVDQYYDEVGISKQAATASLPAGLKSGEAQREYANQQNETLLDKGARYEKFVQDNGEKVRYAARQLAKKAPYEVRAMNDDGFETVDWKKIEDPDGMELQVAPTASLPGTLAGKVDLAYDLMQIGEFDAADVTDIIGIPDAFQRTQMKRGSALLIMKRVGRMLVHGEPWGPPSYVNIDEAIVLTSQMLCLAESKNVDKPDTVPEENLQDVRDFLVALKKLKSDAQAAAPPPPQPMMPGGPMLGPGAAPPVLPGPGTPAAGPGPMPPAAMPPPGMAA